MDALLYGQSAQQPQSGTKPRFVFLAGWPAGCQYNSRGFDTFA